MITESNQKDSSSRQTTTPDNPQTRPSQTPKQNRRLGRRSFVKRLGLGGTAIMSAGAALSGPYIARADSEGGLSRGDVAILKFLAAAEIIESDLWKQYNELALGNESYQLALNVLDGDEATYVNLNTRDEFSHAAFLNAYLESKGHKPVNLEPFRNLKTVSQATGADRNAKRLTNLMNLTVDTSFYFRYRSAMNPDFGAGFPQIVDLDNVPGIPATNLPPPTDVANGFMIQFIANTAGFHFASIEQGGSSLYQSFLPKATSREVIQIIGAIGGTEIQHYQTWTDKAGNAPTLMDNHGKVIFPQLPSAPALPNPPDGTDNAAPDDTNQIFATPCEFINSNLPLCSVIRPTSTLKAGAVATVDFFTKDGLFINQSQDFFDFFGELAVAADAAQREAD